MDPYPLAEAQNDPQNFSRPFAAQHPVPQSWSPAYYHGAPAEAFLPNASNYEDKWVDEITAALRATIQREVMEGIMKAIKPLHQAIAETEERLGRRIDRVEEKVARITTWDKKIPAGTKINKSGSPAGGPRQSQSRSTIKSSRNNLLITRNYWHHMAARIQRAWRNYVRRKHEYARRIQRTWRNHVSYKHNCARKIQLFWNNNKESLLYAKLRDHGHEILAGRKERRRFSLISYRRFHGDYLGVNTESSLSKMLVKAADLEEEERVAYSGEVKLLIHKVGRSSRLHPRLLLLTPKAVYILTSTVKDGIPITTLERRISLSMIDSVAMSNLRDDWMALNLTKPMEEGDPVLHLCFKTELATHLSRLTQSRINVNIGPTIEYAKKKEKMAEIKFLKDETVVVDDIYKSHTVRVSSGESPDRVSSRSVKADGPSVRPKLFPQDTPEVFSNSNSQDSQDNSINIALNAPTVRIKNTSKQSKATDASSNGTASHAPPFEHLSSRK